MSATWADATVTWADQGIDWIGISGPRTTDCTPGYCTFGRGHACDVTSIYWEQFPPGGGWQFAWRR
jgi:hypothetical protein